MDGRPQLGMVGRYDWQSARVHIESRALVGNTLDGLAAAWHESEGERSPEPVHLWLYLSELGAVELHTLNGLVISASPVSEAYDMAEHGRVVLDQTGPAALSGRVGERILSISELTQSPPEVKVGVVLHMEGAAVGIADLGDELVVAEWPSAGWSAQGVSLI